MKTTIKLISFILVVFTFAFSACKKENSDSTTSTGSSLGIQIQAINNRFSLPVNSNGYKSASSTSASVVWDTASLLVSRIKYEAELNSLVSHHDSLRISYEWSGPQLVNLFDTNIVLGNFVLQPGYYDEIELKLEGLKQDAGNGHIFYLHGLYTNDNNTSIPVQVRVDENVMFNTEKDSVTVTAADNTEFTSIIQLYLDQLMAGIELSALDNATLTNGVIVISADSNREIYRLIMQNLHKNHPCTPRHHHRHGHGNGYGH